MVPMQCTRCGALFEGRFCPRCGALAPGVVPPPTPVQPGSPCPRCGTVFAGNFCPRCGLPAGAAYYPAYGPRPSGLRSILSILWILAIVAFLLLFSLNLVGLVLGPSIIVPGIEGVRQGDTENAGLDNGTAGWTFLRASSSSTAVRLPSGGNPDGYLETTSTGSVGPNSAGYWNQSFEVTGSEPFAARVQLDVKVDLGSTTTSATVYVLIDNESAAASPDTTRSVAELTFTRTGDWTRTAAFRTFDRFGPPGTYFLRLLVSTETSGTGTATTIGLDNVRLHWTTDEAVILWVPLPLPVVVAVSQDISIFLAYYFLLVVLIVAAVACHAIRERKAATAAFKAPLESIRARLHNRSALLTLAQVWTAEWFFVYVLVLILVAVGLPPTTPTEPVAGNEWSLLYELTHASVYEEIAFRLMLIGVPMALGSLVLRAIEVNRSGGTWRGPPSPGRHLLGSFRYLLGGTLRRTSTKETFVAAWALLLTSSTFFGLAHAPGWGWWKVLPSAIGGLAFGYLFLRHGITAAILGHFMQDYLLSSSILGIGGSALEILQSLLLLALAIAGAGFFVWYLIYIWRHLADLVARFGERPPIRYARPVPQAASPIPPPVPPPPGVAYGNWLSPPPTSAPPAIPRDPTAVPREYLPTYRPPPYGYPPVRFQCPYCGWVEARYETGHFICARCGKTA